MSFTFYTMSKMRIFSRLIITLTLVMVSSGSGVGKAWDVSPSLQPNSHRLSWPRLDTSPLEVRTISGVGRIPQQFGVDFDTKDAKDPNSYNQRKSRRKEILKDDEIDFDRRQRESKSTENSLNFSDFEEIVPVMYNIQYNENREIETRVRRDAETKMEKIAGTKNVREARLSSPDLWSKQPISVEFRHRTPLDQIIPDEEDIPVSSRRSSYPQTDFITSNRRFFAENRESREMPVARTYDDYDVPIYHSPAREYDVPIPQSYYYPNRYRTERNYRYRGGAMPPYLHDQYPANNFEYYERNRAVTKPKRIIYYATLPEIVRKHDLGNYPRPYDGPSRVPPVPSIPRNSITGRKHIQDPLEPSRRPYSRYPYDAYDYDGYKRPGFYDRSVSLHKESGRRSSQDRDLVPSHKENLRRVDGSNENSSQERKTRDNQDLPWPVQIETEVSVKENERIPGRKIFGQLESYDRYESARMKKASNESDGGTGQESN